MALNQTMLIFLFQNILEANVKSYWAPTTFSWWLYRFDSMVSLIKNGNPPSCLARSRPRAILIFFLIKIVTSPLKEITLLVSKWPQGLNCFRETQALTVYLQFIQTNL